MPEQVVAAGAILIIDDDPSFRALVERWLTSAGFQTAVYADGDECLAALGSVIPAAVCLDLNLPGSGGLHVLENLRAHLPLLPVIILTADSTVNSAVAAMQLGAYDYLVKPVERAKLLTSIKNAVERYQMAVRLAQLEREVSGRRLPGLLGESPALRALLQQVERIAASDITVLVHGESGTGKELVAKAIHSYSGRVQGPFVPLNCAAIPESLQESELFGHEKGAFTGAITRRLGRFEQADQGTLFLDEVAELNLGLQAKLLRVLQERTFSRLGAASETRSDFRLIAASHKDLVAEVKAGRFREDLYFRLAVFELAVPALRERREDIPLLAQHFLQEFGDREKQNWRLAPTAAQALIAYDWPGNVRELQNYMHRATVTANEGLIQLSDLPPRVREASSATPLATVVAAGQPDSWDSSLPDVTVPPAPLPAMPAPPVASVLPDIPQTLNLEALERWAIEECVRRHNGKLTRVIAELGIGRTTLYRRLKAYQLDYELE